MLLRIVLYTSNTMINLSSLVAIFRLKWAAGISYRKHGLKLYQEEAVHKVQDCITMIISD